MRPVFHGCSKIFLFFQGIIRILEIKLTIGLIVILILGGCTQISYICQQGIGQLRLQNKAVPNDKILKDSSIPVKYKQKISDIITYKNFFYKYFGHPPTKIYSRTTLLSTSAVSHMVVASRFDEIKAKENCFWLVGCFPYLGFFEEKSAIKYQEKLEKEGYITWRNPIHAYSTLGYFEDTILSSFFVFDKYDLAELIFHELFHTIFFVKNQVELNENLANFFAEELKFIYFKFNQKEIRSIRLQQEKEQKLKKTVVELINKLQDLYAKNRPFSPEVGQNILREFLQNKFFPQIKAQCEELAITEQECFPLRRKWNNASMTLFLTYENKLEKIRILKEKLNLDLKSFFKYIEKNYQVLL